MKDSGESGKELSSERSETLRAADEASDGLTCSGCGEPLEMCPHCLGGDGSSDAGRGQGGYRICTDDDCSEFEVCCGC